MVAGEGQLEDNSIEKELRKELSMKNFVVAALVLSMLTASPAGAELLDSQTVTSFVQSNARDGKKVITLGGSKGRRWAKVVGGAAIGAVVGAAHAALTGGDIAQDAAVGALVGGGIAFAVTKFQDRRVRGRDEVARDIDYQPDQGIVTNVRVAAVDAVKAGGQVSLKVTYSAIGPNAREAIRLSRYAAITTESGRPLRGFAFTPDPFLFSDGGGEYETTIDIKLVQDQNVPIDPGTYFFAWVVDGEVQKMDSTRIVVNG